MVIESADVFVRQVPMPTGIHGAVPPNDDGTFSIYLNENDPLARQLKAYLHELSHILSDDFYTGKDVAEIECL